MLACKSDRRTFVRVVAALVGALLLFSPYIAGSAGYTPEAASAFGLGFLVFVGNMSMAVDDRRRTDILNVVLGLACLLSPSILGFSMASPAAWLHGAVGAITALAGGYALFALTESRPRSTAELA